MDANIGRVVEAVETAGLTRRTLFIFTSDHGYNVGHHGLRGKGNAGWPLNMFGKNDRLQTDVLAAFSHRGVSQTHRSRSR